MVESLHSKCCLFMISLCITILVFIFKLYFVDSIDKSAGILY